MPKVTIEIKEDGKPLKTFEVNEADWFLSDSKNYEVAYFHDWLTENDRWGYQLTLHLQRPVKEVRKANESKKK